MAISFSIHDLDPFEAWIKRGFKAGAKRGVTSAALRIVQLITTELIPAEKPPPIFNRVYTAGWRIDPTPEGCDVVNTVPYASIIEYGVRGENVKIGKAMIDALTEWVLKKGFVGKPAKGAGKGPQNIDARNIAWSIAVAMKDKGIFNRGSKGLRIGEKAAKRAKAIVQEEIEREVKRELGGD